MPYSKFQHWEKKPKTKVQTSPIDLAEKRAWTWFSKYIRLRDCIRTLWRTDVGRCITCNKIVTFKGNDAWHWITIGNKATKFDERNCHLQCSSENRFQEGMKAEMYEAIRKLYWQEEIDDLLKKSKEIIRYVDYDTLSEKYRLLYNELKKWSPTRRLKYDNIYTMNLSLEQLERDE